MPLHNLNAKSKMLHFYKALKRSRSLLQQALRKRTLFNHYWFAVVILLFFSGVSECVPDYCPRINMLDKCFGKGLYIRFIDATTGENLIQKGILRADSIFVYGEGGIQMGIREDTSLQGIKIDFLGSDFCDKAKKVFYYQNKRLFSYKFYLSYLGKYSEDTLRLEAERGEFVSHCIRNYIINLRALYRKHQGVWEVVSSFTYTKDRPYFILTK